MFLKPGNLYSPKHTISACASNETAWFYIKPHEPIMYINVDDDCYVFLYKDQLVDAPFGYNKQELLDRAGEYFIEFTS